MFSLTPSPPGQQGTPAQANRGKGRVDGFVERYVELWRERYRTDRRPRVTNQDRRGLVACLSGLPLSDDEGLLEAFFRLSGRFWDGHSLSRLISSTGFNEVLADLARQERQNNWTRRIIEEGF